MFRALLCPKALLQGSLSCLCALRQGMAWGMAPTGCPVSVDCHVGRSYCCFICDPQSIGKNVYFL